MDDKERIAVLEKQVESLNKTCKQIINMHTNGLMDADRKIYKLNIEIITLKQRVNKLENALQLVKKEYTREELYKLKQKYSWSKLEALTGIKACTLKYRIREYKKELFKNEEV